MWIYTELPPEAVSWSNLAKAGRSVSANLPMSANALRLVFERFQDRWICEVFVRGVRQGWLKELSQ